MTYFAANGHKMTAVSTHVDKDGHAVPDQWNAHHSNTCPCLTSEDW